MSRASHSCDPDCPHLREDQLDFGQSLFQQIDLDGIVAHNEAVHGSCRLVFKPYAERLLADPHARSDSDAELMIHIPFISSVTLKSFVVVGGSAQTAPARVRLWINREDIDFTNADDIPPTQVFDLNFDPSASVEYMPKYVFGVFGLRLVFCVSFFVCNVFSVSAGYRNLATFRISC